MIDKLIKWLLDEKVLRLLLIACGLLMVSTMINRDLKGDDCWFGEQSYWLAKEGGVKLKSIPLIFNWENEFLVYHKLLIWMGALMVTLFGWSADILRSLNLLFFIAGLWVTWKITEMLPKATRLLILFLIVFVPLSFEKAFEFRPEVFAMTLGLGSFYFLKKYHIGKNNLSVFLAGSLAGLAFLTHLNSVIFCIAGVLLLLFFRNIKGALYFSIAAIPVCFIYFIPLLEKQVFDQWLYNLSHWPLHNFEEAIGTNFVANTLSKVISEHKRFFWGDQIMAFSTTFFIVLIAKGKFLWQNYKLELLYTMLLAICLAALGSNKSPRYLMIYLPFMAIIAGMGLSEIAQQGNKLIKALVLIVLVVQLVFVLIFAVGMYQRNGPHVERHEKMLSNIPVGSKVIGPWWLIYNEIDNYRIITYKTFLYIEDHENVKLSQRDLLKKASEIEVDYMVIDEEMVSEYDNWFSEVSVSSNSYYEVFERTNDYLILKRILPNPH